MITRKTLDDLDAQLALLQKHRTDTAKELQAACKHPIDAIVEAPYQGCEHLNSLPPFRVCRDCGYAETGWGCGYWLLASGVYDGLIELDRIVAMKLVTLRILTQDDMNALRFARTAAP